MSTKLGLLEWAHPSVGTSEDEVTAAVVITLTSLSEDGHIDSLLRFLLEAQS